MIGIGKPRSRSLLSSEPLESHLIEPVDLPFFQSLCVNLLLVKSDRFRVPCKHFPLHPPALFPSCFPHTTQEKRQPYFSPSVLFRDKNIFKVQRGPRQKRGVSEEVKCVCDRIAFDQRKKNVEPLCYKYISNKTFLRSFVWGFELFKFREGINQPDQVLRILFLRLYDRKIWQRSVRFSAFATIKEVWA